MLCLRRMLRKGFMRLSACLTPRVLHACSTCAMGGSSMVRPPSARATSERLRGLQTKVEAASSSSSSSSSSSTTRRSRRRFGARLPKAEPCPVKGPRAVPAGAAPAWDDLLAIGLLPTTLSSVVGSVGYHLHRCWCTSNTKPRCPSVGPLWSGAPCRVPVIDTPSPGQCLRSAR